jgi:hypothetical protein
MRSGGGAACSDSLTKARLMAWCSGAAGTSRRPYPHYILRQVRHPTENSMCRNIKTLHNFAPPATQEEIHASALQFVRKLSGFNKPSRQNEAVFNRAVEEVTHVAHHLH